MKTLPEGLQEHLDTGATTLCWCWRLLRTDGAILGFTDHDRDLEFDSTIFTAATGFTASEIRDTVGLSVDNLDVDSALSSDLLDENDLAAGLYDNAAIEIFRVNWQNLEQRVLMRSGSLGEVRHGEASFAAEIRGLAHYLQQPKGRVYQYGCDAVLGDNRCKLDTTSLKISGTVLAVNNQRSFKVAGLEDYENDWFSRGLLTWQSGDNNNRSMEIKSHSLGNSSTTIELWQPMSQPITPGDTFSATAGCDKHFATCQQKFDNAVNFRGFPHIPGNDFVVSYPNSDDPNNDGASRL
jgi:uncharacterized phage protein (TIGR02218 family)